MSILSGHKKYERYLKTNNGYQLCSMKTYADSVHFSDGTTVQNNLGAIKGITDSLTATSSNVALSAAAGNNLQTQVSELNSNLNEKYSGNALIMQNAGISIKAFYKTCSIGITPVYVHSSTTDVPYHYCQGFIYKRANDAGQITLFAHGGLVIYIGVIVGDTLTWRRILTEPC